MALQSTTALANITLQSASAQITFSGIPSSFRDLVIVMQGSPADTAYPVHALRFNGDTSNNYSYVGMTGSGSAASAGNNNSLSYASLGQAYGIGPATSSNFVTIAHVMDYSATDKRKTMLVRNNVAGTGVEAQTVRWASTSAITSIVVIPSSGAGFAAGTTISLYGVIA